MSVWNWVYFAWSIFVRISLLPVVIPVRIWDWFVEKMYNGWFV